MQEQIIDFLYGIDPLLAGAVLASLAATTVYYLYGGFIQRDYRKITWFRRLLLPHVSTLIKAYDETNENVDLTHLTKTETEVHDVEHVFDLYLDEDETVDSASEKVNEELISNHFRPEVLLASVGRQTTSKRLERGNFVLTSPTRRHTDAPGAGRIFDILTMMLSKYQLHVRYFYDAEQHRFRFYAHHELNPYNPFYAKGHLTATEFSANKGVDLFEEYEDELAQYGVEVTKE